MSSKLEIGNHFRGQAEDADGHEQDAGDALNTQWSVVQRTNRR
ncbi:MAG: hypothetical protein R2851_11295 [Caldilineaceae bacterium]